MNTLTKQPLKKEKVAQEIKAYIIEQKMPPGTRLMSEKNLATNFKVNHLTIRSALSILEESDVIERRPGSGTYVKNINFSSKQASNRAQVNELVAMMIRTEGHLFEDMKNAIFLKLYQKGVIPVILPIDADDFDTRIIDELIRLQNQGCKRLLVYQEAFKDELLPDILKNPDLDFTQVVRIMGNLPDPAIMFGQRITFDYQAGFNCAVDYLKKLGHERILLMVGKQDYKNFGQSNKKITEMYTQAMIHANLAETMKVCIYVDDDDSKCRLKSILTSQNRPTAIIGDIDWRGIKAIEIANELGLKIPEDLSIIGMYNTPWAQHGNMTTISFDLKLFASMIVDSLMDNKYGPTLYIQPELVTRNTTNKAPGK